MSLSVTQPLIYGHQSSLQNRTHSWSARYSTHQSGFNQLIQHIGHVDRAWHLAWNPKKPLLASCSADKTVRLYSYKRDPSTGEIIFTNTSSISTGHSKTVRGVAWAPSGETLATASFDANIGIWEQERDENGEHAGGEWECMSTLEGHETECKSVAYSCTGTLLATCSRDKTVWIWEGPSYLLIIFEPS